MKLQQQQQQAPRLLNMAAAAAYLGLSTRGFEQQWRGGILPGPHRLGRRLLWDRRALDAFVDLLSATQLAAMGGAGEDDDEQWVIVEAPSRSRKRSSKS
jgi:predicted DNA-binding transcriptional regulator AlpA